jgi:hypothetical protein
MSAENCRQLPATHDDATISGRSWAAQAAAWVRFVLASGRSLCLAFSSLAISPRLQATRAALPLSLISFLAAFSLRAYPESHLSAGQQIANSTASVCNGQGLALERLQSDLLGEHTVA